MYSEGSLTTAYFTNISGYTDGIKNRIFEHPNFDEKGFFKMTKKWRAFTNGYVLARETLGVDISLCEERSGVIKKIFP